MTDNILPAPHFTAQPEDEGLSNNPATEAAVPPKKALSPLAIGVTALVAICAVLMILYAWKLPPFGTSIQQTENAYVRGQITVVSPQLNGYIAEVLVTDFQTVAAGAPLFRIDDRIYRQRLEQAGATLAARRADLANSVQTGASRRAITGAREADIASAQAQLVRARADLARVANLASDGSVSLRERDQADAEFKSAQAALRQAEAGREVARQDERSVGVSRQGLQAAVEGAEAAVRLAEIDLANTVVVAPEAGRVGQIGARRGQYVTAGSQLVSLVPPQLWVIANFKERQAGRIVEGQPASVTIDALADRRFSGRVQRISPATGSEFAVLPAQNATGNFTKVSQRLPVRIILDPKQDGLSRLRPGMSVVVGVDTAGTPR